MCQVVQNPRYEWLQADLIWVEEELRIQEENGGDDILIADLKQRRQRHLRELAHTPCFLGQEPAVA